MTVPLVEELATDPMPEPEPIVWEPRTWYAITYVCESLGCRQEGIVGSSPMFYSNNGLPGFQKVDCAADGCCGNDCTILTAVKLDPQPIEE